MLGPCGKQFDAVVLTVRLSSFARLESIDLIQNCRDLAGDPKVTVRLSCDMLKKYSPPASGPVAQLGARFHGMEEVIGSNPIRSTKLLAAFWMRSNLYRFRNRTTVSK